MSTTPVPEEIQQMIAQERYNKARRAVRLLDDAQLRAQFYQEINRAERAERGELSTSVKPFNPARLRRDGCAGGVSAAGARTD